MVDKRNIIEYKMKYILMILFFIFTHGIKLFSQNTPDEFESRRNNFIDKGFGFEYFDDEIINYNLFILRHNNYTKIMEYGLGTENGDKEIEIEYDSIIVTFLTCKYGTIWGTKYKTLLSEIESKDKINYLYGIRHGLSFDELEKIIGKNELNPKINSEFPEDYILIKNEKNHYVSISFSEKKIIGIYWFIKWRND